MPLVVTEEGSGRSKSHGSAATTSSSSGFVNNTKVLRRSRTLNENSSQFSVLERPKQAQRHGSQSLDELVRCAICLDQLCRPTMLPCQHTFCLICLDRYVEKKSNVITCPTCRLQVQIPIDGIRGLPTNILLQAFLESIKPDSSTEKLSTKSSKVVNQTVCSRCSVSAGNDVLTCEHCKELFCKSCHLLHSARLRKSWSKVIDDLFAENQRLSMIKEESEARSKKLRDKIQATVAIQVQQLLEKQDQLLAEVKKWREKETVRLVEVQLLCEELLAETPSIGSLDEEPVPNADVLKRSEAVLERARLCGTTRLMFDSEELTLTCESTETEAVPAAAGVTSAVHHAPVASNEQPTTHHGNTRRKNRRVTFTGAGDPHLPSFPFESSLSLSTDSKKPAELQSAAEEQSVHYRSLSGNPRQRITSSLLQRPAGVAVSPWTGEIYVAATDSHRVYVIDKNGKIVKSLGSPYRSDQRLGGGTSVTGASLAHATTSNANYGTFLCPSGIAFSTVTEEIYVTDKWLNCIQVFNKEGVYVRQIGIKGTSPGHFRSPEGIAVDPKLGWIYVADTCNDRVQVLDRNGVYIRELGAVSQMTLSNGKLYQKREFSEPSGVAVSPDGSVVAVVDSGNCRIKVFNPSNGELIVVFGFRGTQRGQFQQPECLAVDDKGFILVGDNGNGRIQIFRPNGSFVRALGSKGGGPGQFNWISGLTLSKDMGIISTDFKNHCIQIF